MEDLVSKLKQFQDLQPTPVVITGTSFGNELQNKILTISALNAFLLFYLCALATLRWVFQGN